MKRESLYFCLVNKELERLYNLMIINRDGYEYGTKVDLQVRNWAMEQITLFHKAMSTGSIAIPSGFEDKQDR